MALTKVSGSILKDPLNLGEVSIGGTLTYEDVTNVDSVGIITARSNIDCNGDLDVDGHTNLDHVSIAGVTTFSSNIQIVNKIIHKDDTNTAIRFPANDTVTVETAGSERLRIMSNGHVGIGTINAGAPLHIQSNNAGLSVRRSGQYLDFDGNIGGGGDQAIISSGGVRFYTSGYSNQRVIIDSSGRLLLNTTTTYASNQMMIVKGASPSAGGNRPYDGQLAIEGSETTGAVNTGGVLAFIGHSGAGSRGFGSIRCLKEDGTSGNYGSYMSFETRTNGSAPAEKLRIDSSGNLLLGNSTAAITAGIGIMIADAAGARIKLCDSDLGVDSLSGYEMIASGNGTAYLWNRENTALLFGTNNTERFRITADGSVRVGDNSSFTANTNADNLVVGNTNSGNNHGISIISHTNSEPRINFASSADDDAGMIKYSFSSNVLQLYSSGGEKLQCNSAGVKITSNLSFNNWLNISKNGTYAPSTVGHNNSALEGIFWHSGTNYSIARSIYNWSNPYAQLHIDWPTGIKFAGGTSYGLSGARFQCNTMPTTNNTYDLGTSSLRWRDVFCNQGAFNNSDIELKQDIASLTAAEMKAAKRLSALFKTYRWKDAVEEKGTDKARTHTGMIAQQIQAAMSAEGLDATKYGLFGTDEWYENDKKEVITLDQLKDDIPDPLDSSKTISPMSTEGYTKVTRYSVRYTELLSFIAAYNDQRFADLESRVAALEGS